MSNSDWTPLLSADDDNVPRSPPKRDPRLDPTSAAYAYYVVPDADPEPPLSRATTKTGLHKELKRIAILERGIAGGRAHLRITLCEWTNKLGKTTRYISFRHWHCQKGDRRWEPLDSGARIYSSDFSTELVFGLQESLRGLLDI